MTDRLSALAARLDALGSRLGRGAADPAGLHALPERALSRPLRRGGIPGQDHAAGGPIDGVQGRGLQRQDDGNSDAPGQPCGESFISSQYQCRAGRNEARIPGHKVRIKASEDRVAELRAAGRHYSERPRAIFGVQAQAATAQGYKVSSYAFVRAERLSDTALSITEKELARKHAEMLENYIEKAPKYEGEIYRGLHFKSVLKAEEFIEDLEECHVASLDSWSSERSVGEMFAGIRESRTTQKAAVLLRQQNVYGASVKGISEMQDESEVLQPAGIRYKVLAITERTVGEKYPLRIYEVDVEPVEYRPFRRKVVLDSLIDRLERLDARVKQAPGQLALDLAGATPRAPRARRGKPCGQGHISKAKKCRVGQGRPPAQKAAAAAPAGRFAIALDGEEPTLGGLKPTRSLGSGAFGKTYQFDTPDGPVVVKVNGLKMGDPGEGNPSVTLDQQRENVARREFRNLQRAHAAGLGPEPLGELTHLPDGRWSLAYRMLPGAKLTAHHHTRELTPEARQALEQPGAGRRYVAGALQLARRQADNNLSHGDLHGGNVLVGPDGTPSLIDWAMTRDARPDEGEATLSPAARATTEIYALQPLLYFADDVPEVAAVIREEGPITTPWHNKAREAREAYRLAIQAWDMEWEEANNERLIEKMPSDEWRRRMVEANRLKKEGMPYELALRDPRVGLEAPLTPEVLARAAAARDAIFGQSELEQMRRELDQRFGASA